MVKGYSGGFDPYASYYESAQAGVLGQEHPDDRLPAKQFVVGVALGDEAVAYPFSLLNDEPLVNDIVGGTPVLVVFSQDMGTAAVFERQIGGQTPTFSVSDPEALP